jgi:MFS family permease
MLAEKFGGKYALGLGILSTAIFTLLTPLAVTHGGAGWLIAVRFMEGLGEVSSFLFVIPYVTQQKHTQFSIPLNNGRRGKLIINLPLNTYYHMEDITTQEAKSTGNDVINSGTSSRN